MLVGQWQFACPFAAGRISEDDPIVFFEGVGRHLFSHVLIIPNVIDREGVAFGGKVANDLFRCGDGTMPKPLGYRDHQYTLFRSAGVKNAPQQNACRQQSTEIPKR